MSGQADIRDNSKHQLMAAFAGLCVAMFIAALDQTIMATALPTIAGQLGASGGPVLDRHRLRAGSGRHYPPAGARPRDLYGRKGLIRAAILIFIAFSAPVGSRAEHRQN